MFHSTIDYSPEAWDSEWRAYGACRIPESLGRSTPTGREPYSYGSGSKNTTVQLQCR